MAHYRQEALLLARLGTIYPAVASKISSQHTEACEIASRLEEAISEGNSRDILSLPRRFHAIVQHTIIEEERDVFPLADRCFSAAEQKELLRELTGGL